MLLRMVEIVLLILFAMVERSMWLLLYMHVYGMSCIDWTIEHFAHMLLSSERDTCKETIDNCGSLHIMHSMFVWQGGTDCQHMLGHSVWSKCTASKWHCSCSALLPSDFPTGLVLLHTDNHFGAITRQTWAHILTGVSVTHTEYMQARTRSHSAITQKQNTGMNWFTWERTPKPHRNTHA